MSSGQQATRTQGAGPVVICCAAADAGAIATVARELQADGHTVEVVAGVESDPRRLAPVIDRCRGEGLYVLCRSRSLGRDAVDELRDVLLARHVPFGRTLTVASTRPRELRERIVASLSRVAAGRVRRMSNVPPEGAPPKVRRTTQLGSPSPVVQPRPEQKAEAAAAAEREKKKRRGTQLGIPVADVARLAREMHEKADTAATTIPSDPEDPSGPSPEEDTVATAAAPDADTRVDAVGPTGPEMIETDPPETDTFEDETPTNTRLRPPRNAAAAAARDAREATARALEEPPTEPLRKAASREEVAARVNEPDPETDTLEFSKQEIASPRPSKPPPPPPPAPRAAVKPAPRLAPDPTEDSVGRAVITAEDLADLGGTDPKIKLSQARPEDDFDSIPIRSGDTKVQSLLEAGLVRSGDTAVVHVDDVRSGATVRVPALPSGTVTPPPPPASAELGGPVPMVAQQPARNPIVLPAALAGGALLLGIIAAIAFTAGDDDDSDDDDAIAQSDAAKKSAQADGKGGGGGSTPASEGGGEGESAGSDVAVGAPRTKVGEALRSREVQALDILLVTTKTAGPLEYAAAADYCGGLEVAGLSKWRLPDIGELMSLSAAGMTSGGYHWSSTPADTFGDSHLVWYAKRSRVVEREKPNFVVCVRGSVDDG
jgi:hypothetical protein